MDHARMHAAVLRRELLGEFAIGIIHVPVPGFGENQALGGLEPESVNVGEKHEKAGEILSALDNAELGRLFDRVRRIGAGVS
jgi:hypothetical protein